MEWFKVIFCVTLMCQSNVSHAEALSCPIRPAYFRGLPVTSTTFYSSNLYFFLFFSRVGFITVKEYVCRGLCTKVDCSPADGLECPPRTRKGQ